MRLREPSMENQKSYSPKRAWIWGLFLSISLLLVSFSSYALHSGSIRDVSGNIERLGPLGPRFQFAVIGDSRDGEKVYTQLLERILDRKPRFIIHLGDMVSRPNEMEWGPFFEISKSVTPPFFPVVGNHDVGTTRRGEEIYRRQFFLPEGKTYYSFRTGDGLFVILDSEKGKERIVGEQWSWLEDLLSTSNAGLKLVFLHRPLFLPADSFKSGKGMDRYPIDRDNLHRLFLRTGVGAVFAADDHRYDRREKDHIVYVISGGGGAPLYAFKDRGGYHHYVWVSVDQGRAEAEAVDLEGRVRDRFAVE